jgi:hypothetical protein
VLYVQELVQFVGDKLVYKVSVFHYLSTASSLTVLISFFFLPAKCYRRLVQPDTVLDVCAFYWFRDSSSFFKSKMAL